MPTPNLGLVQPPINPTFDLWGADMNQNLALIDAASILLRGTPVSATAPALNQVLKFNGTSWAPAADAGGVTGSGTTGKLPKWTSGTALGDSILSDDGVTLLVAGNVNASSYMVGGVALASTHLSDSASLIRTSTVFGGDLSGTHAAAVLSNIQGNPLITAGAVPGNLLRFDGVNWASSFSASYELIDGNTIIRSDGLTVMGADLNLGSFKIVNLGTPILGTDAANKLYVDGVAQGLDLKQSVRAASVADLTLSGAQTVDGVALIAGDRILVKDQAAAEDNGIYDVAAGAWPRSADADNSPGGEVTSGMFTFVTEGTVNAGKGFVLITPDPIVLGTTLLSFTQFSDVSGAVMGSGTTGKLAKWSGGSALTDSIVSEAGGALSVAGNMTVTGSEVVGKFVGSGGSFGTQVFVIASTDGTGQALALSSGLSIPADLKATFEYDSSADRIRITKGSGTLMSFDRSTNNVGIGVNPDAVYKVTVSGDMNISGTYRVNGTPISGITGSGVANRVAFWSGASALSSNSNFIWDNSLNRFGVGVLSPLHGVHLVIGGRHSAWDSSSGAVHISSLNTLATFPATENVTLGLSARVQANSSARLVLESGSLGSSNFYLKTAGGTFGSFTATQSGTNLGVMGGIGHDGTNFNSQPTAFIRITASEAFTPSAQGTKLTLHTTAIGSNAASERVTILANGNVGVDNSNPAERFEVGNGGSMNLQGGGVYKLGGVQITSSALSDSGTLIKTSTSMGGDLQGNLPNATINKIQNVSVVAAAPTNGQFFYYNGTNWAPGSLGGDLSGQLTSAVVAKIGTSGTSVTVNTAAPPTTGQVLTATGATTANWQTPGGGGYSATVVVAAPTGVAATDTSAISTALTTANSAGGGTVVLREGTYAINATLTVPTKVTIKGQSRSATVLQASGLGTVPILAFPNTGSGMESLTIDMNFGARGTVNANDLTISGTFVVFSEIRFINVTSVGNGTFYFINETVPQGTGPLQLRGCEINGGGSMLGSYGMAHRNAVYSNCQFNFNTTNAPNRVIITGSASGAITMVGCQIFYSSTATSLSFVEDVLGTSTLAVANNYFLMTGSGNVTSFVQVGSGGTRAAITGNVCMTTGAGTMGGITGLAKTSITGNVGFVTYNGGTQSGNIA